MDAKIVKSATFESLKSTRRTNSAANTGSRMRNRSSRVLFGSGDLPKLLFDSFTHKFSQIRSNNRKKKHQTSAVFRNRLKESLKKLQSPPKTFNALLYKSMAAPEYHSSKLIIDKQIIREKKKSSMIERKKPQTIAASNTMIDAIYEGSLRSVLN